MWLFSFQSYLLGSILYPNLGAIIPIIVRTILWNCLFLFSLVKVFFHINPWTTFFFELSKLENRLLKSIENKSLAALHQILNNLPCVWPKPTTKVTTLQLTNENNSWVKFCAFGDICRRQVLSRWIINPKYLKVW